MQVISKPPTDDHTFFMFRQLIKKIPEPNQIYYMWSCPPDNTMNFLKQNKFQAPLAVLGIKDLLDGWKEFNYWHDQQQPVVREISNTVRSCPDVIFLLFTSIEKLELQLNESNLYVIPWGGDWVNQKFHYQKLQPVLEKNFNSDKNFICLNRRARDHRIVSTSYLYGCGYHKYGHISFLEREISLDTVCWEFNSDGSHDAVRDKIINGCKIMQKEVDSKHFDNFEIYKNQALDNFNNFEHRLRPRYQNSFVEIVSESMFAAPGFFITEKTANAFFACNFPIVFGGVGIVQHLRDIGLDVFDDIVDHSYDKIHNPFDRITTGIDQNRRLLTDGDYVKETWTTCRHRFESNINVIKNIYDWYDQRTEKSLQQVLQKIC